MRTDSLDLESGRMTGLTIENYPWMHERHRLFPEIFEERNHKNVLDISSGIGIVAKNITDNYACTMQCNEVDETCKKELAKLPIKLTSFDLDTGKALPLADNEFCAIVCLATIEHLINIDFFIQELHRIIKQDGRLYLSVPNYASLYWLLPILKGRTFHDPFGDRSRYEFYAHVRYFTYQTLVEYMAHFDFYVDTVYLPLPKGSTKFQSIKNRSAVLAFILQRSFSLLYHLSPRWHQEPVICFTKEKKSEKIRKVIL